MMTERWSAESRESKDEWIDAGLAQEGLRLFQEFPESATQQVLLATDLHAGSVLQSSREPWLVIDPKPFVGDPAYDATSHLIKRSVRLAQPVDTIHRFADLLELDRQRVRLWLFARTAVDPWDPAFLTFVRAIAP